MGLRDLLSGTIGSLFQIGLNGPYWRSIGGALEARTADNLSYTILRAADGVAAGDCVTKSQLDAVAVWGTDFDQAEKTTLDTNNTTTWQEYLKLTTTVQGGLYRVGWFYVYNHSTTSRRMQCRVQVDDATNLIDPGNGGIHVQEPKDTNNRETNSGFAYVNLTAGSHDIDLDFARVNGGTASIRHARFEIWRVS